MSRVGKTGRPPLAWMSSIKEDQISVKGRGGALSLAFPCWSRSSRTMAS